MLVDKVADGAGGEHHHQHGDDDGGDHHRHVGDHADRSDHRVEGKHDVDDGDLHNGAEEAAGHAFGLVGGLIFAFQAVVDLHAAFPQQEQTAEKQNQVAPGNTLAEDVEQVVGQAHYPGDGEQQHDPCDHRQGQAEEAGLGLHGLGHPTDKDGDHDDVVDAKDDLQRGQGEKRDPDFRAGQPFHDG